jgi:hypothetical protein
MAVECAPDTLLPRTTSSSLGKPGMSSGSGDTKNMGTQRIS